MLTLWQDLRFAIRTFAKQPTFTFVALLTLALGIGANSAIFSVINGVLLKPMPYKEPERLFKLWESKEGGFQGTISYPNLKDWREQNQVFTQIAVYQTANLSLQSQDNPVRLRAATVSAGFFDVLGIAPQLGRTLREGEDQTGNHRVAILSDQLWRNQFAADVTILDHPIQLGGETFTVIGVMPANFQYPSRTTEIWIPLVIPPQQQQQRGNHFLFGLGRLKDGVTPERAHEEMNAIAARLAEQYPDAQAGRGVLLIQIQEEVVRSVRPALLVLLAAVGFVLLIACTNVANLLLARAAARRREIAIRLALGAGRGRLIRQLLTESILLSLLGGMFGLFLAYWGVSGLIRLATGILPRATEVSLDWRVAGFTLGVAVVTGILFGLVPALQSVKANLQTDLKEGGASTGSLQRSFVRGLLVISEIAAAMVLLIGASLLLKSFLHLQQTDTGLQAENVLTMGISLPQAKYATPESITRFHQQVLERAAGVAGVQSVGIISLLPLHSWGWNSTVQIVGEAPPPPESSDFVEVRAVSPDYFRTLGIPVMAGRVVDDRDQAQAALVIVVNQAFVKRYVPDADPLSKSVLYDNKTYQIVGVVGDVRQSGIQQASRPEMYWHYAQVPSNGLRSSVSLVARTIGEPTVATTGLREAVLAADPAQPVYNVLTMEAVLDNAVSNERFNLILLGIFAGLALVLALIGVYSVMSYLVVQNTREIGIRIAIGARTWDVLRLVIGQGGLLALFGVGIGLGGAFALTRLMETLLFGVAATDAIVFIVASVSLFVVALTACAVPAWRAARIDPLRALRHE